MSIKVSVSEYFQRSRLRFAIFGVIMLIIVGASIWIRNRFGAILLICFAGLYLYFQFRGGKEIDITVKEDGLLVDGKLHPRSQYSGFVLEYHTAKQKIHNIVLLEAKTHSIHTIMDTDEHLESFVNELSEFLSRKDSFEESFGERVIRKIKL
ncbi:hypothetical protein AGMMS50249_2250 [candidate division SR1 bacterium]|nr:hypothetical protein AGMMS50249_2250 [candidate division SR1 bacterium]